jgi:outer membrane scaffolding protein for murein synthesis (MipA/OmpV family)
MLQRALQILTVAFMASLFLTDMAVAGDPLDKTGPWSGVAENMDAPPGDEEGEDGQGEWSLSLGLMSGFSPDYEGSDDYGFSYGPNISASWRDTIYYKGKTLGVNLIRQKNFKAGLSLSESSGRSEDDNEKLKGLGDVDDSIEAGGFVIYRQKPWRFKAELNQDIDSGHQGTLVILSVGKNLPFKKPEILVELGTTWASANYMESFFGVNSQQSVASGLKRYDAAAGIKDIKVRMTSGYAITNRWRIGVAVEYKRLVGDAADSPIVEDSNQFVAGASLSFHMGAKFRSEDPD